MTDSAQQLRESEEERKENLLESLDTSNPEAVPEIKKVVVNVGLGDARQEVDRLETVQEQLRLITGQTPVVTRARKSIADFEIRKGDPSGVKVTLRGKRMEDFLNRLIHLALPMTKEFRGLPRDAFDGQGNYSLGIDEQVVFPEISYEESETVFGMDITLVTSTDDRGEALMLLREYGFPLRED
ncbi:MAG: 50S ribosomal protein L5 [bacterium]